MYSVIRFTNTHGRSEHVATTKPVEYFRSNTNPEVVAVDIAVHMDAIELANYFDREIKSIWDKLKKPPICYKEP